MSNALLVDVRDHVTVFTINRPEKRNAYNSDVMEAIRDAMREFDEDPDQHVGILTGAGDLAFCAGSDLSANDGRGDRPGPIEHTQMFGVGAVRKPMIAAVNGLAVGGGFELALNCDLRIASEDAWFGLFEPKRGIVAGVAVHLLPRMIAHGDAAWILLTGERVPAAEALRMGVVQRVVPHDQLLDECFAVAETIGAMSQVAVQTTKKVMNVHRDALLREGVVLYQEIMARVALGPDSREGVAAFVEKRPPEFTNRWPAPPEA